MKSIAYLALPLLVATGALAHFYADEINKIFYDVRFISNPVLDEEEAKFVEIGVPQVSLIMGKSTAVTCLEWTAQ